MRHAVGQVVGLGWQGRGAARPRLQGGLLVHGQHQLIRTQRPGVEGNQLRHGGLKGGVPRLLGKEPDMLAPGCELMRGIDRQYQVVLSLREPRYGAPISADGSPYIADRPAPQAHLHPITDHCASPLASLCAFRPCRAPHHTISDAGLIGGGHVPMPGDVSLAYHGVRFLDELPECRPHVLEVLRQPLNDRMVTITRVSPFASSVCRPTLPVHL
jgi:hypothetical protein